MNITLDWWLKIISWNRCFLVIGKLHLLQNFVKMRFSGISVKSIFFSRNWSWQCSLQINYTKYFHVVQCENCDNLFSPFLSQKFREINFITKWTPQLFSRKYVSNFQMIVKVSFAGTVWKKIFVISTLCQCVILIKLTIPSFNL